MTNNNKMIQSIIDNKLTIEIIDTEVIFDELFNYVELTIDEEFLRYSRVDPLNYGRRFKEISHTINLHNNYFLYVDKKLYSLHFMIKFNKDIHNKLYNLKITIDKQQ